MMFGGVKFLLPLNGDGNSLPTLLCLFRAKTMARNINGGLSLKQRFFLCLCVCVCRRTCSPQQLSTQLAKLCPDEC